MANTKVYFIYATKIDGMDLSGYVITAIQRENEQEITTIETDDESNLPMIAGTALQLLGINLDNTCVYSEI